MKTESLLTEHIKKAEALIAVGDYDAAYAEFKSAAARFLSYRTEINQLFDLSIAHLSISNDAAAPPHPKALSLIRLRQQFSD